jgi:hypothetical protein
MSEDRITYTNAPAVLGFKTVGAVLHAYVVELCNNLARAGCQLDPGAVAVANVNIIHHEADAR